MSLESRKKRISAIVVLGCNIIKIDDFTVEWLEAQDFNITALAKAIGIDIEHKARAKLTIEITEERCHICNDLIYGDSLCASCGEPVCDKCANLTIGLRRCPKCVPEKPICRVI